MRYGAIKESLHATAPTAYEATLRCVWYRWLGDPAYAHCRRKARSSFAVRGNLAILRLIQHLKSLSGREERRKPHEAIHPEGHMSSKRNVAHLQSAAEGETAIAKSVEATITKSNSQPGIQGRRRVERPSQAAALAGDPVTWIKMLEGEQNQPLGEILTKVLGVEGRSFAGRLFSEASLAAVDSTSGKNEWAQSTSADCAAFSFCCNACAARVQDTAQLAPSSCQSRRQHAERPDYTQTARRESGPPRIGTG